MWIFLYGPPGSGKSTIGRVLAQNLKRIFIDLDVEIERASGMTIPRIFAEEGEAGFRKREKAALQSALAGPPGVLALGGGTLLDPENRRQVEAAGKTCLLSAQREVLLERLAGTTVVRPLLVNPPSQGQSGGQPERLLRLLAERERHYASFACVVDSSRHTVEQTAWQAQIRLGIFHVSGMAGSPAAPGGSGYDVLVQPGGLTQIGDELKRRGLKGPVAVVSDSQVAPLCADRVLDALHQADYTAQLFTFPAGEQSKTLETASRLWGQFLQAGLERGSTVVALGGGVVSDLAGFTAATYKRGVAWVVAPTSLIGMADASLGGKTGVDLPEGKNLVGAFHAPALVLSDPQVLNTLPEAELCAGLGEVIKAGVIGDEELFEQCGRGLVYIRQNLTGIVQQAIAVKIAVIEADPYERGLRASLNFGHTVGHALEKLSQYELRHGEAVAIGMVVETRMAEGLGIAPPGLTEQVTRTLSVNHLPHRPRQGTDWEAVWQALQVDKKRTAGLVHFALPEGIGKVRTGVRIEREDFLHLAKQFENDEQLTGNRTIPESRRL